jgi:hypothetical protein
MAKARKTTGSAQDKPRKARISAEKGDLNLEGEESTMPDETRGSETAKPAAPIPPAASGPSAPSTEKAVPTQAAKATSQYVVTVDNNTCLVVKIEKLDEGTGDRKELSASEYLACMAYAGQVNPASALTGAAYSASAAPLVQGYWQGYVDYLKALTSTK